MGEHNTGHSGSHPIGVGEAAGAADSIVSKPLLGEADTAAVARVETEGGPFEPQASVTFSMNKLGARVEVSYSNNSEPDEKNVLHVLVWYIAHAMDQLLPIAINSWHLSRSAMLAAERAAANEAPPAGDEAPLALPAGRIVGADNKPLEWGGPERIAADNKPLDPSGVTGD